MKKFYNLRAWNWLAHMHNNNVDKKITDTNEL